MNFSLIQNILLYFLHQAKFHPYFKVPFKFYLIHLFFLIHLINLNIFPSLSHMAPAVRTTWSIKSMALFGNRVFQI